MIAIDENEQEVLGQILDLVFPRHDKTCVAVIHNKKGIQGDYFSHNHEYAYFVIPLTLSHTHGELVPETEWEYTNLRKWGRESERATAKNCFYPIVVEDGEIVEFGEVCEDSFHPRNSNIVKGGRIAVYPIDGTGVERKWRYARGSVEAIRYLLKVQVNSKGTVQILKAVDQRPVKTVWDDNRYIAGDYGTKWLTELGLKVRDDLYPKSVHLVEDSIFTVTSGDAIVVDYFGGSGTTGHAIINLNREDSGRRKFTLVEMGDYFDTVLLPRIKKVTYSPEWSSGKPVRPATPEEAERSPRIIKVVRLESYEDTLNNLRLERRGPQQLVLKEQTEQGADSFREEYFLRYLLDLETRGSPSLLDVDAFRDPTAYQLIVKRPGSDESGAVNVDLLETFNWLLGLTVRHIAAPRHYRAAFTRDDEGRLRGSLEPDAAGPLRFRSVTGTLPDGREALIIWRKLTGDAEQDNHALDEWFQAQGYLGPGSELAVVYANGGSTLEALKPPDARWKARLIEEEFHRLMFATEGL